MNADAIIWLAAIGPGFLVLAVAFGIATYLAPRQADAERDDFVEIVAVTGAGFSSPAGA